MTEQSKAVTVYQNYQKIKAYGQSPEVLNTFVQLLGKSAPHYIQSALTAVQSNETLMDCTPRSIFRSALRAATLGLSCDPSLGHAYIVPYKNKDTGEKEAQFQPGWHGVQQMAIRTGKYAYINVSPVYEGEKVVEDRITGDLKIEGGLTGSPDTVGLIASFKLLTGYKKSIYMSNEELEEHGRKYSKMYNRSDSIWKTNKKIAYHKTILLKLLRTYGYLDPMDMAALDNIEDGDMEVINSDLPGEDEVTIIDSKPLSTKDANKLLGIEDDEQESKPERQPTADTQKPTVNKYARPMDPEVLKETPKTPDWALPQKDSDLKTKISAREIEKGTAPDPDKNIMTIEKAAKITNSEGDSYIDLPNDKLQGMVLSINKALKSDVDDEKRAEYQEKKQAIGVILKARANKEI